ncbi:DMT family transporter [Shinella sp. CPCC 101442]|uniref:DMT family transporter n=1 Tax=Shinella sp. CPCC 101442 TaxID=2932265 RepID=UPI0021530754|nr:DMT family transporter [Shinella sp. CPCC 101442]MCR6497481.1 DMT family transporter [Shinella sp. CPCC 101442]
MRSSPQDQTHSHPLGFLVAFGTGGLLALMVQLNGALAHYGNSLFSSWTAHATGTVAALLFLLVLPRRSTALEPRPPAPLWAYLGGLSGAATVVLSSMAVNSPAGLPGTLALGLAGQLAFGLAADGWGLFGLPKRRISLRDFAALALVLAGSLLILLAGNVTA